LRSAFQDLPHFQDPQFECLPFKKSQDLITFFRMHSHLFKVNAGLVTLVPLR
jgi:hypothetical protein